MRNNVISNSKDYWNIESWWPAGTPTGRGNTARDNCLSANHENSWFNTGGDVVSPQIGFTATNNTINSDPAFTDRTAKDFHLSTNSLCKSILDGAQVTLFPTLSGEVPPTYEYPKKKKKKGTRTKRRS